MPDEMAELAAEIQSLRDQFAQSISHSTKPPSSDSFAKPRPARDPIGGGWRNPRWPLSEGDDRAQAATQPAISERRF